MFADRIRLLTPATRFLLLLVALDGQRTGNLRQIREAWETTGQHWEDRLLEDSDDNITPLGGSKLWQVAVLEYWLQVNNL